MPLTIVTYHYVRDLKHNRYPTMNGRDIADFRGQLDYICSNYDVVTTADVVSALKGKVDLPYDACWLTFDDGYLDHFTNVLPLLFDRGLHGAFFAPVNAILYGELLDVNKGHFIRAAQKDTALIIEVIKTYIDARAGANDAQSFGEYWSQYARRGRYDTADVMFIKQVLQHALPQAMRNELVNQLFERFVTVDQKAFAQELYVSPDQLRMMIQCGMYVGGHGAKHYWLDMLNADEQEAEIDASLEFLADLGAPSDDWVMCYPHGGSDEKLRALLIRKGCAAGLTIESGVVDIATCDPLLLPRRDTNELPLY